MKPVISRVRDLWLAGEKVVVFCFYVETGRALRAHISRALEQAIADRASERLEMRSDSKEVVLEALDRQAGRLLRADSAGLAKFREHVTSLVPELDHEARTRLGEVVVRFMRTPSFLVRFVNLSPHTSVEDLLASFDQADGSGLTLSDRIRAFGKRLAQQVPEERDGVFAALSDIQTGGIRVRPDYFDDSDRSRNREILLPNVRLANGGVRQETRQKLMRTFNSPFFPEVLIASSVMSEGVDLHQDCRYVIHHDLDWNPSTLEQRTGRLDRIGSKAEAVHKPVMVYEPYLAGTHDEKMFRVVKDRAKWFGIVMGEAASSDERVTEREAARVPLPTSIANGLTMDLSLK